MQMQSPRLLPLQHLFFHCERNRQGGGFDLDQRRSFKPYHGEGTEGVSSSRKAEHCSFSEENLRPVVFRRAFLQNLYCLSDLLVQFLSGSLVCLEAKARNVDAGAILRNIALGGSGTKRLFVVAISISHEKG